MKMLNIPIAEPSVPSLIYLDNIAKGNAKVEAQPIPAKPIAAKTTYGLGINAINKYDIAIVTNDSA